ncbi:MAG: hypothetical protein K6E72_11920 [Saccharofermentans sp.]|nr:hypothetical protein [Saccharofermentans sp.]
MKKVKKIAATLLCLGLAISTLCGCSSTGNSGEQPAEETTTKQTEAVTEAPTTEEPSEETTQEPTTVAPKQNTITGFFMTQWANDVRNTPDVLFIYEEYMYRCGVTPTDVALGDFQLEELSKHRNPFSIAADPILDSTETYSINFYVYNNSGALGCCFQYGDTIQYLSFAFAPVWYNESKGVIVGWMPEGGTYKLVELYYDVEFNEMNAYGITDMSEYGF